MEEFKPFSEFRAVVCVGEATSEGASVDPEESPFCPLDNETGSFIACFILACAILKLSAIIQIIIDVLFEIFPG